MDLHNEISLLLAIVLLIGGIGGWIVMSVRRSFRNDKKGERR